MRPKTWQPFDRYSSGSAAGDVGFELAGVKTVLSFGNFVTDGDNVEIDRICLTPYCASLSNTLLGDRR